MSTRLATTAASVLDVPGVEPRIFRAVVRHVRTEPLRNDFSYRTYQWFVDLDHLPRLPRIVRPLARFESRDHVGDPTRSMRANLESYLAEHGIDLHGGRICMLANARVLGWVFNPLSVFWCHDADGSLVCVVAEVHNTYRGRHRYLLHTDPAGRARVDKEFFVSPFYGVDGEYRMSLPEPDRRLDLTITLHPAGGRPFVATLRGTSFPGTTAGLLRTAVLYPWVTLLVSVRIRLQGITLWRRGLPVVRRRDHHTGGGSRWRVGKGNR